MPATESRKRRAPNASVVDEAPARGAPSVLSTPKTKCAPAASVCGSVSSGQRGGPAPSHCESLLFEESPATRGLKGRSYTPREMDEHLILGIMRGEKEGRSVEPARLVFLLWCVMSALEAHVAQR